MTIGERIFWRVFAADVLLAALWLILGGSVLEIVIIAVLQAGILMVIEGAVGAVHQMVEDINGRRIMRWEKRRSR